jgi:hypothetical protein
VTCDICATSPDFHRFQWYEMRVERNSREEAAGGAPLCLLTLHFSIAAHQPLSSADAFTLPLLRKRDGLLLHSAAFRRACCSVPEASSPRVCKSRAAPSPSTAKGRNIVEGEGRGSWFTLMHIEESRNGVLPTCPQSERSARDTLGLGHGVLTGPIL